MNEDYGWLTVRAQTAGAYPVEGALVKIRGAEENNSDIVFSLITDKDGLTDKIRLPTPPIGLSQYPGAGELPYSVYDLEIIADGYIPKRIYGLTVFPKTGSIQIIGLVPEEITQTDRR